MAGIAGKKKEMTALLLIAVVLVGLLGGLQQTLGAPGGSWAPGDEYRLNAGVTIKTQKAADNLFKKGALRGIDVSKYQGKVDWKKVAGDGIDFAFARSGYGLTADATFVTNVEQANANGIKVGAYHFATFKTTAEMKKQAQFFLKQLKKVNLTYPAVLDLEDEGGRYKTIKKSTLTKLATGFMDIIKAEGYDIMLYTGNNFYLNHLDDSKLKGYDKWIANYLEQPSKIDHQIWQHTSYGTVSGVSGRVDINIAYNGVSISGGNNSGSGSGGTKKVKVNKTVSDSIKETLNDRYNAGLPLSGLNMANMNAAISKGLQREVNRQWGLETVVDGQMTREQVNTIASARFTSSTKGNITYLIQAKLFYKGYYEGALSAQYDSATVAAVKAFQKANDIEVDGKLDAPTLHKLLL